MLTTESRQDFIRHIHKNPEVYNELIVNFLFLYYICGLDTAWRT